MESIFWGSLFSVILLWMVWVFSVTVARELTNTTADRLLVEIVLVRLCFPRLNYFVTEKWGRSGGCLCCFFLGCGVGGLLAYCMLGDTGTVGTYSQTRNRRGVRLGGLLSSCLLILGSRWHFCRRSFTPQRHHGASKALLFDIFCGNSPPSLFAAARHVAVKSAFVWCCLLCLS